METVNQDQTSVSTVAPSVTSVVEFEVKAESLLNFVKSARALADEVKVAVDVEAKVLRSTFVDPAHVAMGSAQLNVSGMVGESVMIGIDVEKLADRLKSPIEKNDPITVRVERQDIGMPKLVLKQGRLSRSITTTDPVGITDPKFPKLDVESQAVVNVGELEKALRACGDVSDHVTILVVERDLAIMAQSDDDEDKATFEGAAGGPRAEAKYSLDYLHKLAKALREIGEDATLRFATDYPLSATSRGDGLDVTYLLAPRIE